MSGPLRIARFFEGETRWPYKRQSPAGDGVFGSTRFLFGAGPEPADWLLVLNGIPDGAALSFPMERAVFLSGEPPSIRSFNPRYLAQFGLAVSVDPDLPHPRRIALPPQIPWHAGICADDPQAYAEALSFAQLAPAPAKTRLCSCITSTANYTPGHRLRLAFVERLQRELGDRIDFFGRGLRPIPDKDLGLASYRYHIALENCALPHYWTEKLADPFLRNCFPIYYGAPNIDDYFDAAALAAIDIADPNAAIARIAHILDSDLDARSATAVSEAKRRVMWEHNLLARLDRLMTKAEVPSAALSAPQAIVPEAIFHEQDMPWHLRAHRRLKRGLRQLRTRRGGR